MIRPDHTAAQAAGRSVDETLAELRAQIREWQNNLETFGPYSQEAARVALDGVLDMIEDLAPAEAKSATSVATSAAKVEVDVGELAALRRDAARYRWIRNPANLEAEYEISMKGGEQLDKAIDAKLAQKAQ